MHVQAHIAGFASPARNVGAFAVEPGMVIADLGAGSGHYTLEFAAQLAGTGRVYAIDVQRDLLRRIKNEADRRGFKNVETITGDVERPQGTHIAERAIDIVLLSNVLFQLEDPSAALNEAWRIVKPSGKVAIIDWSDSFGGMGPTKKHVVKKERALELAKAAGFELVREFDAGTHHYGLILKPTAISAQAGRTFGSLRLSTDLQATVLPRSTLGRT